MKISQKGLYALQAMIIALGYIVDGVVFKGMERHLQNKWGLTSAT